MLWFSHFQALEGSADHNTHFHVHTHSFIPERLSNMHLQQGHAINIASPLALRSLHCATSRPTTCTLQFGTQRPVCLTTFCTLPSGTPWPAFLIFDSPQLKFCRPTLSDLHFATWHLARLTSIHILPTYTCQHRLSYMCQHHHTNT